jgi:hypothetical protein
MFLAPMASGFMAEPGRRAVFLLLKRPFADIMGTERRARSLY